MVEDEIFSLSWFHQQWVSHRAMAMAVHLSSNIQDLLQHRMRPVQQLEVTLGVEGQSRIHRLDHAPPPSSLHLGRVATTEERSGWILWMEKCIAALYNLVIEGCMLLSRFNLESVNLLKVMHCIYNEWSWITCATNFTKLLGMFGYRFRKVLLILFNILIFLGNRLFSRAIRQRV